MRILNIHLGGDVDAQLTNIENLLKQLGVKLMALDATVQAKFDELKAEVTAETTVVSAVKTLLDGLTAQIAALKATAANASPEVIQAIADLETAVDANKAALSAAVVANTPAA